MVIFKRIDHDLTLVLVSFVDQDISLVLVLRFVILFIASHSSMPTHFPLEGGHGISLSPSFLTLKFSLILVSHQTLLGDFYLYSIQKIYIFGSLVIIQELIWFPKTIYSFSLVLGLDYKIMPTQIFLGSKQSFESFVYIRQCYYNIWIY